MGPFTCTEVIVDGPLGPINFIKEVADALAWAHLHSQEVIADGLAWAS